MFEPEHGNNKPTDRSKTKPDAGSAKMPAQVVPSCDKSKDTWVQKSGNKEIVFPDVYRDNRMGIDVLVSALAYSRQNLDTKTLQATAEELAKIKPQDYAKYTIKLASGAELDGKNALSPERKTSTLPSLNDLRELREVLLRDADSVRNNKPVGVAQPSLYKICARVDEPLTPRQISATALEYGETYHVVSQNVKGGYQSDFKNALSAYAAAALPVVDFAIKVAEKREQSLKAGK